MEFKDMTMDQLIERKAAIKAEIEVEGADLDALEAEIKGINEEIEKRKAAEEKRAELRQAVASGCGVVLQAATEETTEERKKEMFGIDTIEYRNAWLKDAIGRDLNEEERAALSSSGAVIPTMTVNEVWDKLVKDSDLLGKVDISQFPNYVRFPKATTVNAAAGQAIGTTITEASDVIGYVDLTPNEYVKLLTVGCDIDSMAIDAIHTWIVNNLTDTIRYAINKDILVGTNSNTLKGITGSVNADATAIPSTVTKASLLKIMGALPAKHQAGAIWVMTPEMFYENIMSITQLNDYIINDGFSFRLFGHDVVLMSEAKISSKETIFYGDPKAYKVNFFKPIEVKRFETATTTNLQFRGATLVDGELLDTTAFVRFAQT